MALRTTFAQASFLPCLQETDAAQLESLRPKFFVLKVQLLQLLCRQIRLRARTSLVSESLKLITTQLTAVEVEFLLRMDRAYERGDIRQSLAPPSLNSRSPGGLSALLLLVGHVEKELTIGTLARTRDLFDQAPAVKAAMVALSSSFAL